MGGVIIKAARVKLVPGSVLNIISDYLSERRIIVYSPSGSIKFTKVMICGVPQGSVLGPDLCNFLYDSLLKSELPHDHRCRF